MTISEDIFAFDYFDIPIGSIVHDSTNNDEWIFIGIHKNTRNYEFHFIQALKNSSDRYGRGPNPYMYRCTYAHTLVKKFPDIIDYKKVLE